MEDKKKKRWFLLLLLLLFLLGLGLLAVSKDLPFSHDPYEDERTVFRVGEEEKQQESGDVQETAPADDVQETAPADKADDCKGCEIAAGKKKSNNLKVSDETGKNWASVRDVNIFSNEEFEGKALIAPESTGVYRFFIVNDDGDDVSYHIETKEKNDKKIPMVYRLKCNGVYVSSWQTSESLTFDMEQLKPGKRDILELEWRWRESEKDTEIGQNAEGIQYHLYIRLQARRKSS